MVVSSWWNIVKAITDRRIEVFCINFAVLVLSISESLSVNCPPGMSNDAYGCEPCPKSFYKVGEGPGPCTKCIDGLITNHTGSNSISDCYQPCQEGQYMDEALHCLPCPENTYRNKMMDMCVTCGDGLVTQGEGATSISECVPCERGRYRHWILCKKCHEDPTKTCSCRKSPTDNFVSEQNCQTECPASNEKYEWSDFCQPCRLNTYKEEGEIECKPCPNGTVTTITGAYDVSNCIHVQTEEADTLGYNDTGNDTGLTLIIGIPVALGIALLFGVGILWCRRRPKCMDNLRCLKYIPYSLPHEV